MIAFDRFHMQGPSKLDPNRRGARGSKVGASTFADRLWSGLFLLIQLSRARLVAKGQGVVQSLTWCSWAPALVCHALSRKNRRRVSCYRGPESTCYRGPFDVLSRTYPQDKILIFKGKSAPETLKLSTT